MLYPVGKEVALNRIKIRNPRLKKSGVFCFTLKANLKKGPE